MPRTTIGPGFCAVGRMPPAAASARDVSEPTIRPPPSTLGYKATDDADRAAVGRSSRAAPRAGRCPRPARRPRGRAAPTARASTPAPALLTLEAFCGDAEAVLAHAARAEQPAALALVDIDDFRSLNARRGPAAGDAALLAVAERLRGLTRASDVIGRTGADELAVLMPGTARARRARLLRAPHRRARRHRHPGRGLHHRLGRRRHAPRRHHDRAPAGRRRARPRPRPRRRRRPRRGAARPRAASNPFRAQAHVIEALATALVERDRYTGEHSAFVVEMARTVAAALGLDEVEVERVGHAALLHDIGKVGDARPRPAQARPAGRRGVGRHARAPGHRRAHPARRSRAWAASRASSATSTSASTAPATPTASPARRSRSAAASSWPATPTTR